MIELTQAFRELKALANGLVNQREQTSQGRLKDNGFPLSGMVATRRVKKLARHLNPHATKNQRRNTTPPNRKINCFVTI